jgi:hypothetical protein
MKYLFCLLLDLSNVGTAAAKLIKGLADITASRVKSASY